MWSIKTIALVFFVFTSSFVLAQGVPGADENIPFLVTFGNEAEQGYGDDDFSQSFFFVVPETQITPVFIRIFDPNVGGEIDENIGGFNTKTRFSVYGGAKTYSEQDAQKIDPVGKFKSGNMLDSRVFGDELEFDDKWFNFGPYNPKEGEFVEELGGYVFKVISEGIVGNDGNLFRYFMSVDKDKNEEVEGGNAFTYEYSFRLHDDVDQVSHIYPYVGEGVISIKQYNFDFDADGVLRVISIAKNGELMNTSREADWATSTHTIKDEEHNTSLDIQFIKAKSKKIKNNNIVFYLTNQYGEFLPFYTVPIGGIPKFRYKATIKKKSE
ncbi:hypothetical protein R9C00_17945 [Flammeovirgaceae bacterium SG7u.111]|nr:hypothetical protein [Flammeovirgaceae bacterium SG7u.132]WPO33587.1 hypothetical protein R9C00_17945 [Flammeovirgaceae bacterium SG7u.111]